MKTEEDKIRSSLLELGVADDQVDTFITQFNQSLVKEANSGIPYEKMLALEEFKIKQQIDYATDPTTKAKLAARLISLNL